MRVREREHGACVHVHTYAHAQLTVVWSRPLGGWPTRWRGSLGTTHTRAPTSRPPRRTCLRCTGSSCTSRCSREGLFPMPLAASAWSTVLLHFSPIVKSLLPADGIEPLPISPRGGRQYLSIVGAGCVEKASRRVTAWRVERYIHCVETWRVWKCGVSLSGVCSLTHRLYSTHHSAQSMYTTDTLLQSSQHTSLSQDSSQRACQGGETLWTVERDLCGPCDCSCVLARRAGDRHTQTNSRVRCTAIKYTRERKIRYLYMLTCHDIYI